MDSAELGAELADRSAREHRHPCQPRGHHHRLDVEEATFRAAALTGCAGWPMT